MHEFRYAASLADRESAKAGHEIRIDQDISHEAVYFLKEPVRSLYLFHFQITLDTILWVNNSGK